MSEPTTVTKTAPERIWLQHSDDMLDVDLPFPEEYGGISWCHEQVFMGDVEYIRKDLCATLKRQRDMLLEAMNTFTPAIDRVLWIALNWNDHNFGHEVIRKKAREAASALGIPDSDSGMNPSKERERLFNMWNEAIAAVEGEK